MACGNDIPPYDQQVNVRKWAEVRSAVVCVRDCCPFEYEYRNPGIMQCGKHPRQFGLEVCLQSNLKKGLTSECRDDGVRPILEPPHAFEPVVE